ncbi:hypothetical protein CRG98_042308 [Punica granatum]|uniref:Uncharacterized protein n=1 Tax=Punica granatum TaxID=22663 RepID=A0A2I0I0E5_PUNGR|nr:hypothetical protein CRG98_042308 [Punica granatum]
MGAAQRHREGGKAGAGGRGLEGDGHWEGEEGREADQLGAGRRGGIGGLEGVQLFREGEEGRGSQQLGPRSPGGGRPAEGRGVGAAPTGGSTAGDHRRLGDSVSGRISDGNITAEIFRR